MSADADAPPAELFAASQPCVGEGTAFAVDTRRGAVYAFGGALRRGDTRCLTSALHRYDVECRTWTPLQPCEGCAGDGVLNATALCSGDSLYFFGGSHTVPELPKQPSAYCTSPAYHPGHYYEASPPRWSPPPGFSSSPPTALRARYALRDGAWAPLSTAEGEERLVPAGSRAPCATLGSGVAVLFPEAVTDAAVLFTFATRAFSRLPCAGDEPGESRRVVAACASACGRYVFALRGLRRTRGRSFYRLDSHHSQSSWAWEELSVLPDQHSPDGACFLLALPSGGVLALCAAGDAAWLWEPSRGEWRAAAGPNPGGAAAGTVFAAAALLGAELLLLAGVHKYSGACVAPAMHATLAGGPSPGPGPGGLARDLGALLESAQLADVRLVAADGAVAAHRAVLAARSPYFRALLAGGPAFREAGAAEVALPAVQADALRAVLAWLYTGRLTVEAAADGAAEHGERVLEGVLEAASLFALDDLQELLTDRVAAALRPDNALRWLLLAQRRGAPRLQHAATAFVTAALRRGDDGGARLLQQLRADDSVPRDLLVQLLECVAACRGKRARADE